MRRSSRGGFTLIEVALALALAGLVVVLARAILATISDQVARITQAASIIDTEAGADRLVRSLITSARETSDSAGFLGSPRGVVIPTWCPVSGGWRERCRVVLALSDTGRVLSVYLSTGDSAQVLRRGIRNGGFDYLKSARDGGEWVASWPAFRGLPLAIRIILDADTSIVPIWGAQ